MLVQGPASPNAQTGANGPFLSAPSLPSTLPGGVPLPTLPPAAQAEILQRILEGAGTGRATSPVPALAPSPPPAPAPAATSAAPSPAPATPAGEPLSPAEAFFAAREPGAVPLRQFGYDSLAAPVGQAGPLGQSFGAVPEDYLIGRDDELVLAFRGRARQTLSLRVGRDGALLVPDLAPVPAAGRRLRDLRADLEVRAARDLGGSEVYVSLGQLRQIAVFVGGEVQRPGMQALTPLASVLDALAAAGGVRRTGIAARDSRRRARRAQGRGPLPGHRGRWRRDPGPLIARGRAHPGAAARRRGGGGRRGDAAGRLRTAGRRRFRPARRRAGAGGTAAASRRQSLPARHDGRRGPALPARDRPARRPPARRLAARGAGHGRRCGPHPPGRARRRAADPGSRRRARGEPARRCSPTRGWCGPTRIRDSASCGARTRRRARGASCPSTSPVCCAAAPTCGWRKATRWCCSDRRMCCGCRAPACSRRCAAMPVRWRPPCRCRHRCPPRRCSPRRAERPRRLLRRPPPTAPPCRRSPSPRRRRAGGSPMRGAADSPISAACPARAVFVEYPSLLPFLLDQAVLLTGEVRASRPVSHRRRYRARRGAGGGGRGGRHRRPVDGRAGARAGGEHRHLAPDAARARSPLAQLRRCAPVTARCGAAAARIRRPRHRAGHA